MKYLILGAGPAGLTFANLLKRKGETSFLVLEAESEAGGLCRTVIVDGAPFDIGGGHFLDVRDPEVVDYLFEFMPIDEWNLFTRDSQIDMGNFMVSHPLEANIWQLPQEIRDEYLRSIAVAGCNRGIKRPVRFVEWITWKLGDKIAQDYMLPYNQKVFADQLDELGTYWLEKLPNVSYDDIQKSCTEFKAYGKQPGHSKFYYPKKYGYGEVWLRMAQSLGGQIEYQKKVCLLDFSDHNVKTTDGAIYSADKIIVTIPWNGISQLAGVPDNIRENLKVLKSSSIETRYFSDNLDTKAQWIYIPDMKLPYHRILVRHNFCPYSKGYWTETRGERTSLFSEENSVRFLNEYAYPLNTVGKPEVMKALIDFGKANKIYALGRWGEHSHYNSDVVVKRAIHLVERLI